MKVEITKQGYEKLKKRAPWLYQNELKIIPKCDPGTIADLIYKGEYVATAFINPLSKITARIVSFEKTNIDKEFFEIRIKKALKKEKNYRLLQILCDLSTPKQIFSQAL